MEGLEEKTTETHMQIDRADKQSEGFVDQVFEPTAVPQSVCAHKYPSMTLRLTKVQSFQSLSLAQGRKPYWVLERDGEQERWVCQSEVLLEFFYISALSAQPLPKAT